MENKQYVKIIVFALALWPALVFGYDNDFTHPLLTSEAAKLFYLSSQQKLAEADIASLVRGSKDEDDIPRWLEHFYDPINNRGLNAGQFATSKQWAHGQNSTGNDYSWENAIYEYVYGDRQKSFYALGHIVHLVQDATVPDHTRDDVHVILKTYEAYALTQKTVSPLAPIYLGSLDAYFDSAANFSNNNFFSDDTILNYYQNPRIMKELKEEGNDGRFRNYGYNGLGKKITLITNRIGESGVIESVYSLYDKNDNKVMADYWGTLAPKAVGYSAGIIKLFFEEAQKEKEIGALKKLRMPWWEKLLELVSVKVDQVLASVNLSLGDNNLSHSSSTLPAVLNSPSTLPVKDLGENLPAPSQEETKRQKLTELRQQLLRVQAELGTLTGKGQQSIISGINSANLVLALAGAETVNVEAPTTTASTSIAIASPVINLPADLSQTFSTSTIIFSGTASSSLAIFNDFNQTQATTSLAGEWSMLLSGLPQGTSTIKFFARDEDGNVSLPAEINLKIDSLPLAINFLINNCAESLASDFCLLKPTSTLNLVWSPTKSENYTYDLMKGLYSGWSWSWEKIETTNNLATAINLGIMPNDLFKEFKWQVLARDIDSNTVVASSSEIVTVFHPRPIVINEIGWAGTMASPLDEWLELHNYLYDYTIDLNNYYLTDSDKTWQVNLSGSITPKSYYLIERGDDGAVSNRLANLIANFVDGSGGKAFNPAHLGLKLWRKTDLNDELIDETPIWDRSQSGYGSLERTWEDRVSTDLSTWEDNFGCSENDGPCALDRNLIQTFGTPGVINRASIPRLW